MKLANRIVVVLSFLSTACCSTWCYGQQGHGRVSVHHIDELNTDDEPFDSHSGEELDGVLQPVARYMQTIPCSVLGCKTPIYARVKKLADGSYMLMYQNSRIASTIYYSLSRDLLRWSAGKVLFKPQQADLPDGSAAVRKFSSGDATVLANGDILAYASYRSAPGYRADHALNGIMMRRSTDNGLTWGEYSIIYRGTTWEPYILQLPSGELNCYFTDTEPLLRNSGTSMVVSTDNGWQWTPEGVRGCYKVIRQYKYDNHEGGPTYTDQMPCVRMLNDGRTLLGFMEARLEPDIDSKNSTFRMSLVYGRDHWQPLADGESGPTDRQTNIVSGAAGYVAQFRSGETLISCNRSNIFSMKLGSADGRAFKGSSWEADWYTPFAAQGYWGSTEVIDTHKVLATIHCTEGIQLGMFYLNHRIDAPEAEIVVDGDNTDWTHTQALYLGGRTADDEIAVRAAHDSENLYLLVERTKMSFAAGDDISIYLCSDQEGSTPDNRAVRLTVSPDGKVRAARYRSGSWRAAAKAGVKCKLTLVEKTGTENAYGGYVAETKIPLSAVGIDSDCLRIMVATKEGASQATTFTDCRDDDTKSWIKINLKPNYVIK